MDNTPLSKIYDAVTLAHANIQQDFKHIDPIVGVITSMRKVGIQADAMTIDCLKTGQRILLVFHDHQPELVSYQFGKRDEDPADDFQIIPFQSLTPQQLYQWMKDSFSP